MIFMTDRLVLFINTSPRKTVWVFFISLFLVVFSIAVILLTFFLPYLTASTKPAQLLPSEQTGSSATTPVQVAPNQVLPSNLNNKQWVLYSDPGVPKEAYQVMGSLFLYDPFGCQVVTDELSKQAKALHPFSVAGNMWVERYSTDFSSFEGCPETLVDGYYFLSEGTTSVLYLAEVKDGVIIRDNLANVNNHLDFTINETLFNKFSDEFPRVPRPGTPESWIHSTLSFHFAKSISTPTAIDLVKEGAPVTQVVVETEPVVGSQEVLRNLWSSIGSSHTPQGIFLTPDSKLMSSNPLWFTELPKNVK